MSNEGEGGDRGMEVMDTEGRERKGRRGGRKLNGGQLFEQAVQNMSSK